MKKKSPRKQFETTILEEEKHSGKKCILLESFPALCTSSALNLSCIPNRSTNETGKEDEKEEGEETVLTLAQLEALPRVFMPAFTINQVDILRHQMILIENACEDFSAAAYEAQVLIQQQLEEIEQLFTGKRHISDAFQAALALHIVMGWHRYWFEKNTDGPEAVKEIVKQLDHLWTRLFARTNEELTGITLKERKFIQKSWSTLKRQVESCYENDCSNGR